MPEKVSGYQYDVALSFAGEHRAKAEHLAELLRGAGLSVFYDNWEESELWGCDLVQHLDEVYSRKALFCVIFISAEYVAKAWTRHELRSAQARAFREKQEYILPVRLDDTAVPGLPATVGILDLRQRTLKHVAEVAVKKVTTAKTAAKKPPASPSSAPKKPAAGGRTRKPSGTPLLSGNLPVKQQFTEHDRDLFLEKAFASISKLFKASLAGLKTRHKNVVGEFRKLTSNHFTAVVYRDGKSVSKCGVRLSGGSGWGGKMIAYSDQPESTNNMNDSVTVADDGQKLFLKAGFFGSRHANDQLTPAAAAEMFWARLMAPLLR